MHRPTSSLFCHRDHITMVLRTKEGIEDFMCSSLPTPFTSPFPPSPLIYLLFSRKYKMHSFVIKVISKPSRNVITLTLFFYMSLTILHMQVSQLLCLFFCFHSHSCCAHILINFGSSSSEGMVYCGTCVG